MKLVMSLLNLAGDCPISLEGDLECNVTRALMVSEIEEQKSTPGLIAGFHNG